MSIVDMLPRIEPTPILLNYKLLYVVSDKSYAVGVIASC